MKATTKALVRSHKATRKMMTKTNARVPHKAVQRLRKLEMQARATRLVLDDLNLTMAIVRLGPQA